MKKAKFLQDYSILSTHRSAAFDYTDKEELWDTFNVSGLQHRVARLTGIANYSRRNLAKISFDVYEEKDDDNITEYRFRIKEKGNRQNPYQCQYPLPRQIAGRKGNA